jgi:hypothetical protein
VGATESLPLFVSGVIIQAAAHDIQSPRERRRLEVIFTRVAEPGKPAFQLRKGEEGISVFIPEAVQPPLTEQEIVGAFRPGSVTVTRTSAEIEAKELRVVAVTGADSLPERLRAAHAEIRPGAGMSRARFKQALQELE